jgi:hypothetical protein
MYACVRHLAVATTHDYFSALRARALAAETLENRGISRNHISAGLEYDGWTQLQIAGRMKGVGYDDEPQKNTRDTFWFWRYTEAVTPDYVAVYAGISEPLGHGLLRIPFTTWLPPFRRAIVVLRRADLLKQDGATHGY